MQGYRPGLNQSSEKSSVVATGTEAIVGAINAAVRGNNKNNHGDQPAGDKSKSAFAKDHGLAVNSGDELRNDQAETKTLAGAVGSQ